MASTESQRIHVGRLLAAIVILTVVWAVWMESFALWVLLQGALLSALALHITNRHLLGDAWQERFKLHPLTLLRFLGVLVVEIFRSGFHAMWVTVTGRIDVGVVDLPTRITDPLHGTLVANAITLTPGTVTVEYRPGSFKVVWIECATTDADEAAEMIKGRFERVFVPD